MIKRKRKLLILITLLLLVPLSLMGSFVYGFLCNEKKLPPFSLAREAYAWSQQQAVLRNVYFFLKKNLISRDRMKGHWQLAKDLPESKDRDDNQQEVLNELLAVGYLSGYEKAPELNNVTTYVPEFAYDGFNLYTSGNAPEAILMNMKGEVLHKWFYEFKDAFPDLPQTMHRGEEYWRRVHLYDNGDLLAIYEYFGLIKLDKDSNLIWANPRRCHHDLFVDENGFIYVLSTEIKNLPRIHKYELVWEDFITVLDPDGNVVRNISLLEVFERSSYASFLDKMPEFGDLFHTNTIEVLDGSHADRSPIFKKGNILISACELNVIAIVDMEQEKVVWALSGQWVAQHQPTLLDNGNILILDNRGHSNMSKVIEIDPFTQEIVWSYEGNLKNDFCTRTLGSNQRLVNGNTLITESDSGRAFEVTWEKQIVWEFYNPARAGEKNELIATLLEVVRLAPDYPMDWLKTSRVGS